MPLGLIECGVNLVALLKKMNIVNLNHEIGIPRSNSKNLDRAARILVKHKIHAVNQLVVDDAYIICPYFHSPLVINIGKGPVQFVSHCDIENFNLFFFT
ncbi:hypothetical protein D3C76_1561150 [compost metagenome]